jgi:hypothetical protein
MEIDIVCTVPSVIIESVFNSSLKIELYFVRYWLPLSERGFPVESFHSIFVLASSTAKEPCDSLSLNKLILRLEYIFFTLGFSNRSNSALISRVCFLMRPVFKASWKPCICCFTSIAFLFSISSRCVSMSSNSILSKEFDVSLLDYLKLV